MKRIISVAVLGICMSVALCVADPSNVPDSSSASEPRIAVVLLRNLTKEPIAFSAGGGPGYDRAVMVKPGEDKVTRIGSQVTACRYGTSSANSYYVTRVDKKTWIAREDGSYELIDGLSQTDHSEENTVREQELLLDAGEILVNNLDAPLSDLEEHDGLDATKKTAAGDPNFSLAFVTEVSYKELEFAGTMMSDYGYALDKELSTIETKVFYNKELEDLIIMYRGSQTKEDWTVTDTALASGNLKKTSRYKRSDRLTKRARKKYSNARRVTLFGHSLGGALASELGNYKKSRDNVVTYNKGVGVKNFSLYTKSNPNEVAYRIGGDIVSMGAKFDKNVKRYKASFKGIDLVKSHNDIEKAKKILFFRPKDKAKKK